jgi:hypothetical protein
MIRIKWGKNASGSDNWSFAPYSVIGKLYGIDGSSVRRLVLKRLDDLKK